MLSSDCIRLCLASAQANQQRLLSRPAAPVNYSFALVFVHILCLTANKGFIRFNLAGHHLKGSVLHCKADTVKQEPRAFLRDADGAMNLVRANAVLRVGNHPHRAEPLIKTNWAIFHHGSEFDREHLFAFFALPSATRRNEGMATRAATRASNAIRPSNLNHKPQRIVGIGKVDNRLLKSARKVCVGGDIVLLVHHRRILAKLAY